jgi:hypothetical protein
MAVHLIASADVLAQMPDRLRARLACRPSETLDDALWAELEAALAGGDSLIVLGTEALPRLRPLWVQAYDCPATQLRAAAPALLPLPAVNWRPAACRGLCVRPDTLHAYFGHDEMPRLELVPLLEAVDETGHASAYAAVWLKHVAASLVGGRFAGSNWYLFALDDPLAAASAAEWSAVLGALCDHAEHPLAITAARTHYRCHRPGETVLAEVRLANRSRQVEAVRLELSVYAPDGLLRTSRWVRRCLNGDEAVSVPWEFAAGTQPGLWRVRVALHREDRFTYGAARAANSTLVESAEFGFVVASADPSGFPAPVLAGRALSVAGSDGFLAGTHYYPSSSWWDWAWRDFRPEHAQRDLQEMARLGYRLVRVWLDPELDEVALRGLDAWLHLSGAQGLVSIVCVFTQWARHLSYPEGEGMRTFEFMGPADYNVYSVQLKNIEHQQRYLATLARRWRDLPNVIWNLANEVYLVDPSPEQVDARFFGDVEPKQGPLAGAALFNRWADLMTAAVRDSGAPQPILRGYGFINGGDCYLQNRTGDLLPWHHYASAEIVGPCLAFGHPGQIERPLLLEEFGLPTLDEAERRERYEGLACWAAVMGAAGACSYEWGVSWLTRELPYVATPLKDSSLSADPDPQWMNGQLVYAATWPVGTMGLCPWAASFSYGSNYPCTPFPTPAAAALGEVARFCANLGPPVGAEPVLLVVPMEWADFVPFEGYARLLDPTWQAVQLLAAAHVPFTVTQEDQLPGLADPPLAVVFPASQPLKPDTQAQLARLAALGAAVHVGPAEAFIEQLAAHVVDVTSGAPVWCLRRGTRDGYLYLLFAPDGPTWVTLRDDQAEVELDLRRYALIETARGGGVRRFIGQAIPSAERETT